MHSAAFSQNPAAVLYSASQLVPMPPQGSHRRQNPHGPPRSPKNSG
uniref:Uncharacterized protein n=1 Tax=Rhizophora mucronata TaxID=61149 RepID=A0A2P2IT69_RHIMU